VVDAHEKARAAADRAQRLAVAAVENLDGHTATLTD
jgi:hypothetical protein